jgi:hypothetical protein
MLSKPEPMTLDEARRELARLRPVYEAARAIERADFASHTLLEALRDAVRAATP